MRIICVNDINRVTSFLRVDAYLGNVDSFGIIIIGSRSKCNLTSHEVGSKSVSSSYHHVLSSKHDLSLYQWPSLRRLQKSSLIHSNRSENLNGRRRHPGRRRSIIEGRRRRVYHGFFCRCFPDPGSSPPFISSCHCFTREVCRS